VALSGAGENAPLLAVDYAKAIQNLPKINPESAIAVLAKVTDAQRLARTNVSAALVGEFVRMALTSYQ